MGLICLLALVNSFVACPAVNHAELGHFTPVSYDQSRLESLDEFHQRLALRRGLQITRLREYATCGVFPRNTDFPDRLTPYFVDDADTACAVGHLMRVDGWKTVVADIAANSNHIRIEAVDRGPLLDWIRGSGLTQAECALIQPNYAMIEDYRRGHQWQSEQLRLKKHFAQVEQTLLNQSQRSLAEALIKQVDTRLKDDPDSAALTLTSLGKSLESDEPNVRIAAAYALARLDPGQTTRGARIALLAPKLADPDPAVRFWTAVALERIGSASAVGTMKVRRLTLPIFLATFRGNQNDLRLPALIQLANLAPESLGTSRQLRVLPDVRRALVDACRDQDDEIRKFAEQVMSTWRWQRTVYESQRMRRHYLAASFELEATAAESLAIGQEYVNPPRAVKELIQLRAPDDIAESIFYVLPVGGTTPLPIAATKADAVRLVEEYDRAIYAQWRQEPNPPSWKVESVAPDSKNLYYAVTVWRTDMAPGPKMIFIVPRPSMLAKANVVPSSWLETVHQAEQYVWPAAPPSKFQPQEGVQVKLGEAARNEREAFTATCDVFAYFMAQYLFVILDRDVQETDTALAWTARVGSLRQDKARFFELGGGGSSNAGEGAGTFIA